MHHTGRHRRPTYRELQAENHQFKRMLTDREYACSALEAERDDLKATGEQALAAAGLRIAQLTEELAIARQAADLNAHPLHVPPAEPIDADGDKTQPMDCRALRAAVGTSDNPRTNWAKPVVPVIPLHGVFGPAHPGRVDGDTTHTIPIPTIAA